MKFRQDELDRIHSVQLEMLAELDRICRKYNIKYIISGGTLLGAVRDGKFIPWDDDIDVRMDRAEYIKFANVCNQELDTDRFFFQDHNTDPNYPWYYGKMRYNHSHYTRVGQEHLNMHDGIFIDIMPADGLPNNTFIRHLVIMKCFVLKKFLYSAVGSACERNGFVKTVYRLMNLVPKRYIFKKLDKISERYMSPKYGDVTSYSFVVCGQKQFTKREWHFDCVEISFEGISVLAPRAYHEWLVMTYGDDYMTPPPVKDQVGHNEISRFSIEELPV